MTITTSLIQLIRANLNLEHRISFSTLQDSINFKGSHGVLQFVLKSEFMSNPNIKFKEGNELFVAGDDINILKIFK